MIERVVVPLDGSVTAEIALPYAQEMIGRRTMQPLSTCVKIIRFLQETRQRVSNCSKKTNSDKK